MRKGSGKCNTDTCSVPLCDKVYLSKGFCRYHYLRAYRWGLTLEEMTKMQAGLLCVICFREANTVDHCHTLGHNRGYVCQHCNLLLGYIEQDSVDRVQKAIEYLKDDYADPGHNWNQQFGEKI